jgi:hypothetical protein
MEPVTTREVRRDVAVIAATLPVMRAPRFVRFCRTLALVSGAPLFLACSSSDTTQQSGDAKDDTVSTYDGVPVGTAPCDGGCGVVDDAGNDTAYDGHPIGVVPGDAAADADDTAYDGHPVGVSIDAGPDFGGGGGGPQSLPDLPYLG